MANKYAVIGRIHLQNSRNMSSAWEIAVDRVNEYGKLPMDSYRKTREVNRKGIGVTLQYIEHECQASLHRLPKGNFHIGSARLRLGPEYTELFKNFLRTLGFTGSPMEVHLEFDGYYVRVSKLLNE